MLIETISGPLAKALLNNHGPVAFDAVRPFGPKPLQTQASVADFDGVVMFGTLPGGYAPNRLLLVPYCDGPPGSQFSVRLWGLRGFTKGGDPNLSTWLPVLLGEYLCTAANLPGPDGVNSQRFLGPTETLCDTITLTHGALGVTGLIVSPGSDAVPGPDLTAFVVQDLFGSGDVYFDFQPEAGFQGTMNCAYARA